MIKSIHNFLCYFHWYAEYILRRRYGKNINILRRLNKDGYTVYCKPLIKMADLSNTSKYNFVINQQLDFILFEGWLKGGEFHRIDGPATIAYNDDGGISMMSWYINGVDMPSTEINNWIHDENIPIPLSKENQVLLRLKFM